MKIIINQNNFQIDKINVISISDTVGHFICTFSCGILFSAIHSLKNYFIEKENFPSNYVVSVMLLCLIAVCLSFDSFFLQIGKGGHLN